MPKLTKAKAPTYGSVLKRIGVQNYVLSRPEQMKCPADEVSDVFVYTVFVIKIKVHYL